MLLLELMQNHYYQKIKQTEHMQPNDYIFGIRAVIEAIEAGKEIDKILMKKELS